eukprot:scaffold22929_cov28-Prasinocladus_malaysianus.AAC.1
MALATVSEFPLRRTPSGFITPIKTTSKFEVLGEETIRENAAIIQDRRAIWVSSRLKIFDCEFGCRGQGSICIKTADKRSKQAAKIFAPQPQLEWLMMLIARLRHLTIPTDRTNCIKIATGGHGANNNFNSHNRRGVSAEACQSSPAPSAKQASMNALRPMLQRPGEHNPFTCEAAAEWSSPPVRQCGRFRQVNNNPKLIYITVPWIPKTAFNEAS